MDMMWYIYRVKSGSEVEMAKLFSVPVYVPHRAVTYFNRRLRKTVRYFAPAFPSFLFVRARVPSDVRITPHKNIYGVMRLGDRSPAALGAKAFKDLRNLEKELRTFEPDNADRAISEFRTAHLDAA